MMSDRVQFAAKPLDGDVNIVNGRLRRVMLKEWDQVNFS